MSLNFAITGVGGYVATRHLKAIYDTGNRVCAAVDPSDSVGVLDRFSLDVKFFKETERFDRHLDKLRRGPEDGRIQYVSICSPNYLHDSHIRIAFRNEAHAICEKPLVINPWNLDALASLQEETGRKVYTILQLRVHPSLIDLRRRVQMDSKQCHEVVLTYVTSRGPWYHVSWKGSDEHSGGIAANIGIHLFDLLLWLFGAPKRSEVHLRDRHRMAGRLELERANVLWFLSVNRTDLPPAAVAAQQSTFRSIAVDGKEVEFTEGFTDLHTRVYEAILEGRGFGIDDARPSIELVYRIRTENLVERPEGSHPMLCEVRR